VNIASYLTKSLPTCDWSTKLRLPVTVSLRLTPTGSSHFHGLDAGSVTF